MTAPLRLRFLRDCGGQDGQEVIDLGVKRLRQDDGQNRNRACFRSATRVMGWMGPAGVMCFCRSWPMTRYSPPSSAVTWAGLLGGEQDPVAEQR
jgi:hypothetical protein